MDMVRATSFWDSANAIQDTAKSGRRNPLMVEFAKTNCVQTLAVDMENAIMLLAHVHVKLDFLVTIVGSKLRRSYVKAKRSH